MKNLKTILELPLLKKIDLQLFAEDGQDGNSGDDPEGGNNGDQSEDGAGGEGNSNKGDNGNKTFTQEELEAILRDRLAQQERVNKKKIEEAKSEAEKLAKMNEEQKKAYEQEKLQQQNAELLKKIQDLEKVQAREELSKSAASMLRENHKISATQDILDFVVGEDADVTNKNIEKFVAIIQADRKQVEIERATGYTPKNYSGSNEKTTAFDRVLSKYNK